jgi:glycerol-3-phosphate acyltransferase PlsY
VRGTILIPFILFLAFIGAFTEHNHIGDLITLLVFGSVGYLMVRWLKRVDVRAIGSGNVGATNVSRAAGFKVGALVLALDAGKGLVATLVIAPCLARPVELSPQLVCGLAAVLGHMFPITMQFRGGKGVATTLGVFWGAMPGVAAIYTSVLLGGLALTRYMSVGAVAAAAALPLIQWLMGQSGWPVGFGVAFAALIILQHRGNIVRLARGTEHRVGRATSSLDEPRSSE